MKIMTIRWSYPFSGEGAEKSVTSSREQYLSACPFSLKSI